MPLFGKNLKWLRMQKDVNQHFISELVSRKANTISNWENDIAEPSISDLLIISKFFDISVDELLTSDMSKRTTSKSPSSYTRRFVQIPETVVGESDAADQYFRMSEFEKRLNSIDHRLESITQKLDDLINAPKNK